MLSRLETVSTETVPDADEALASAHWDLEPLVFGRGGEGAIELLAGAHERAEAFATRHRGQVAELDAQGLAEALAELEEIYDAVGRAGSYANLRFATATADPERGALLQRVREDAARIQTALLFFELEWNELAEARAEQLLEADELAGVRHHLRSLRRYRPHQLSEPEERVMTELDVTGASAMRRLFTEQISGLAVELSDADRPAPLAEALSRLLSPDRDQRAAAATGISEALAPGLRTRAFIFNTLAADKATRDRLRSYEHWLASRNLANEASDESVAALIDAVQARGEIVRGWYRLKAKLLGLERLAHYDRMAPVIAEDERIAFADARSLVLDAYRDFSPELGAVAEEFFTGDYIDAPPAPDKRGGAFCAYTVASAHPYVMLNFTARPTDVLTVAHELGHGVHATLARPRGLFEFSTPLTVAETASIFGETIVLGRLLEQAPDDTERLALLGNSLDGAVGAVFRQVAMNRFEDRVHGERRGSGELSVDDFASAWIDTQTDLLGDSVDLSAGYASWWSYVPHFIATPGYVYAYSYGHLLALSVYGRYEQEGEGFVESYLDLLRAGGSRSPEELGEIVGVDLADPGFWNAGLDLIERQLERAERTADAVSD